MAAQLQAQRPIAGLEQCFAIPAFVPRDDLLRFRRSFLQVIRLGHYRSRSVPAEAVVRANLYHLFCNHAKVADLEELRMKDVLVALLKHPNKHIKASAKGLLECDPYFSLPRVQPLSMGPPLGQGRTASTAPGIAQPPSPASAALPRGTSDRQPQLRKPDPARMQGTSGRHPQLW
ncbi:hypothetical protein WJX72_011729 [[Myrmecia] bisecta]|uniref:Uncharacterized protein n=1 Tax=[Myrmecia] bisecta TaxID=41462 RepID=A0AAW1PXV3_9CHLO